MHISDVEETSLPAGAGWRARDKQYPYCRRQEGEDPLASSRPRNGRSSAAEICRHQALRPRRRRSDDPGKEAIIKYGASSACARSPYGMAHRGRLNMLTNVMAKPYRAIFHEFSGGSSNFDDVAAPGDGNITRHQYRPRVRRHHRPCRWSPIRRTLEAADPVVLGSDLRDPDRSRATWHYRRSLPVLL